MRPALGKYTYFLLFSIQEIKFYLWAGSFFMGSWYGSEFDLIRSYIFSPRIVFWSQIRVWNRVFSMSKILYIDGRTHSGGRWTTVRLWWMMIKKMFTDFAISLSSQNFFFCIRKYRHVMAKSEKMQTFDISEFWWKIPIDSRPFFKRPSQFTKDFYVAFTLCSRFNQAT